MDNDTKDQKLENIKKKLKKNGDELEVLKNKTIEKCKEFDELWKGYLDLLKIKKEVIKDEKS